MTHGSHIKDWNPENTVEWESGNKAIARRNLICTIAADHAGFSIFALWSVMAMFMPPAVYGFSAADKFLLGATATLVGACARIPYTLGIARFGSRAWTVGSAVVLVIPVAGTIALLSHPGLPFWPYLLCAALTGLGGANFAASMANVNALYPQRIKGWALAANAGLGNSGAAIIQAVGLVVLAIAGNRQPYWVCAIYLVLLVVVAIAASLFMDTVPLRIDVGHIRSIVKIPDTWLIVFLYICTFGSWVGFTFAFGQVMSIAFARAGQSAAQASLHALQLAFIGPLLGSLIRVPGGWISDRLGGGRVTLAVLIGLTGAATLLITFSSHGDHTHGALSPGATTGYVAAFLMLFALSGIGNASVFKLIPSIFEARSQALDCPDSQRRHWVQTHSGALIGLTGAMGALGGVGINLVLRHSYLSTGSATSAYWVFLAAYGIAALLTWQRYVRPSATMPSPARPTRIDTFERARH